MKKWGLPLVLAFMTSLMAGNLSAKEIEVETATGMQTVTYEPKRIVILDFATLDTLRQLGESSRIVGASKGLMPHYLTEFSGDHIADLGNLIEPAFEKIHELQPDLIIAATRQKKNLDRLKEIAPVLYLENDYRDYKGSLQKNIIAIAQIVNQEALAKQKLAELDQKMDHLKAMTKGKTALVLLVNESKISAFGGESRYGMAYKDFGFSPIDSNLSSSTHGNSVGFEYVLEKNPEYLLVVDRTAAVTGKPSNAKQVLDNAIMAKTQAVQHNRVIYLNPENWYLAFGGLESMNMMINEIQNVVK